MTQEEKHIFEGNNITYFKHTRNYVLSENEIFRMKVNFGNDEEIKKYLKYKTEDENGNYIITSNEEIDQKVNFAIKRDYTFFNKINGNYKEILFNNLGYVEVFNIDDNDYLIESKEDDKHKISIAIYKFIYAEKWLNHLNNLLANYCFGTFQGIKEDIIEDAQNKGINNIDYFAENIENLFNNCLDFHNDSRFENVNYTTERYKLLDYIGVISFWKQKKDKCIIECNNNLINGLEELYISSNLYDFIQTRDFIAFWISKVIQITINDGKKMFEWYYSPYKDDVFKLGNKIKKLYSDERISLKNSLITTSNNIANLKSKTETAKTNQTKKNINNLTFSEIKEIENSGITITEYNGFFEELEQMAFKLRGQSNEFYVFLSNFFKNKAINNKVQVCLLKELTNHNGNWKHDFLIGMYEDLTKSTIEDKKETKVNQHNNIFSNNGFELFDYILQNHITKGRGRYNDLSFYYWKLYDNNPQFIHQRPEVFKNWFCEKYNENFAKIKTLNEVENKNRNNFFSSSLDWFKQTS